ncbi:MAG TPA: hypothetical protein VIX60_04315 [Candidatus Cybelea sp.]
MIADPLDLVRRKKKTMSEAASFPDISRRIVFEDDGNIAPALHVFFDSIDHATAAFQCTHEHVAVGARPQYDAAPAF